MGTNFERTIFPHFERPVGIQKQGPAQSHQIGAVFEHLQSLLRLENGPDADHRFVGEGALDHFRRVRTGGIIVADSEPILLGGDMDNIDSKRNENIQQLNGIMGGIAVRIGLFRGDPIGNRIFSSDLRPVQP